MDNIAHLWSRRILHQIHPIYLAASLLYPRVFKPLKILTLNAQDSSINKDSQWMKSKYQIYKINQTEIQLILQSWRIKVKNSIKLWTMTKNLSASECTTNLAQLTTAKVKNNSKLFSRLINKVYRCQAQWGNFSLYRRVIVHLRRSNSRTWIARRKIRLWIRWDWIKGTSSRIFYHTVNKLIQS